MTTLGWSAAGRRAVKSRDAVKARNFMLTLDSGSKEAVNTSRKTELSPRQK
jgi:hypothetical protein